MKVNSKHIGKNYMENFFELKNLGAQVQIECSLDRRLFFLRIYDYETHIEKILETNYGPSILGIIRFAKHALRSFREKRKKVVWKKYQDQNFKIGVIDESKN